MLENRDDKLILGLPKGSLEAATTELFAKAGYKIEISSRSLYPTINDPEIDCMLLRAQEMAMFVEEVCELVYGKVGRNPLRWVLAVPENSDIKCAADLEGKRIATEAVGMTKRYLAASLRTNDPGNQKKEITPWQQPCSQCTRSHRRRSSGFRRLRPESRNRILLRGP